MPQQHPILDAIPTLDAEVPASQFVHSGWWVGAAVAVLLLVIAAGVSIYIRRRRRRAADEAELTPLQRALNELAEVEAEQLTLRECSLRISLLLRRYLQGELSDPALFETHEEFSRRVDSLAAVPEQCQRATRSLLDQLAELKYDDAREAPADTAHDLLRAAHDLLLSIRDAEQHNRETESRQTTAQHCFPVVALAAAGNVTRELTWAEPSWLWALLLLIPLLFLRRRMGAAGSIRLPSLSIIRDQLRAPRSLVGRLGPILFVLSAALLLVSLARPQWRNEHEEQKVSGIDIMIACDLSGSMSIADMSFTLRDEQGQLRRATVDRLKAAKHVISSFIAGRPNDRIGLLAFAGRAKLCSPLTLDHAILKDIMAQFYLADPGSFGRPATPGYVEPDGTAIGTAIAGAATRLHERKETKSKVIILVTDGVSNSGTLSPVDAARQAAKLGIKIFTIAIGRDERLSRYTADVDTFDEKTLREIADITGGRFYRAGSGAQLQEAFRSIDSLEKTDATRRRLVSYESLFMYPLGLAGLLLALGFSFSFLRTRSAP